VSKELEKKLLGEERREWLLNYLKNSSGPVTGTALAKKTNVSRQVIVGDMTLLKARNEPIIATSQGYLYMRAGSQSLVERIIACQHDPSQAEQEMNIIVDHGVTVKNVIVEHPVYGDLTASIMVSNRKEVQAFLKSIRNTNASLLSELTSGLHLHILTAADEQMILNAKKALNKAGILAEEN